LAFSFTKEAVSVPFDVTGLPLTEKIPGMAKPTEVTVPVPLNVCHVRWPEPSVERTWLLLPLVAGS
jgi:hypothetical protein